MAPSGPSTSTVGVLNTPSRLVKSIRCAASTSTNPTPGRSAASSPSSVLAGPQYAQNSVENCTSVARSPSEAPRSSAVRYPVEARTREYRTLPARTRMAAPTADAHTSATISAISPVTVDTNARGPHAIPRDQTGMVIVLWPVTVIWNSRTCPAAIPEEAG